MVSLLCAKRGPGKDMILNMNIQLLDSCRLKIYLEKQDLQTMDITFEQLNYDSPPTKQMIGDLLDAAKIQTGFDADNKKLFIEAFQTLSGGCTLYFTVLGNDETPVQTPQKGVCVMEFEQLEDAARALGALKNPRAFYQSKLYAFQKVYRLVLYANYPLDKDKTQKLTEFGTVIGRNSLCAAFTAEHGRELMGADAVNQLLTYFS